MEQLPSRDQILQWLSDNPSQSAKRDIARAFGIKGGAMRIELKRMLKELEQEGAIERRKSRFTPQGQLPPVALLRVGKPDADGDLFASPTDWTGEGAAPKVLIHLGKGDPALGEGDRILARIETLEGDDIGYRGRLIRRIGTNPQKIMGIFRANSEGGRIVPIDKRDDKEWRVAREDSLDARDGELVEAEQNGPRRMGLPRARITERLGDPSGPRAVSLIAIHQHDIPDTFPDAVIAEADAAQPMALGKREDLRGLDLVTIDPPDARDRDDAVLALRDPNPANAGGFILWVAIADVAAYVRPGSALDREARKRGNSSYFPDRVVPMLPDMLSGDLCSLHEAVDRPCMAVEMVIDADGNKLKHRFTRGMMRSRASLSYAQVQSAIDGHADEKTAPLLEDVLRPLYEAYDALKRARAARQPLELDLPERKIVLSEQGEVTSVAFYERFDAHKLIEECMVLANVAAAEELIRLKQPLLFRVHEEPSPEKLESLREVAESAGFSLAKGQVLKTAHLNRLLSHAAGSDHDELLNITTLRSMTQAYYYPENFGHFGLALRNYAHFTSPIRRYSDLIVHRALISGHGWGDDGLSGFDREHLADTAKQISDTERRSMTAERDTTDRYLALWLKDRVGASFAGRISGVQRFGLFVRLDESGADALIPIRSIGREFFHFDADRQLLVGSQSGQTLGIGQRVKVRLAEVTPLTGGIVCELLEVEENALAGPGPKRGKAGGKGGGFMRRAGREAAGKKASAKKLVRKQR